MSHCALYNPVQPCAEVVGSGRVNIDNTAPGSLPVPFTFNCLLYHVSKGHQKQTNIRRRCAPFPSTHLLTILREIYAIWQPTDKRHLTFFFFLLLSGEKQTIHHPNERDIDQIDGGKYKNHTPQNRPSTPRPCVTTFHPAIKLTSHNTDRTRIGSRRSSVLCRKGKALYPRKVM
jgi:hypothetical protein